MRYLVIGGGGFIGSNLCDYLLKKGHEVLCTDTFTTGVAENLDNATKNSKFKFLGYDYKFRDLEKCDGVFILAGSVGNRYIDQNPRSSIINNVSLTRKIFNDAHAINLKVMYFSTSEVYGDQNEPMVESSPLTIGPPDQMRWGYSCSKLLNEFLAFSYDFPCVVVRPFNISGKRQLPHFGMVIPNFVKAVKEENPIHIYGDGLQTRCFCHIDDAVDAFYKLMLNKNIDKEVFNIGNPTNKINMRDLANLVCKTLDLYTSCNFVDYKEGFERNHTDIHKRIPSIEKISNFIGWKPKKGIEEIIKDVYSNSNN